MNETAFFWKLELVPTRQSSIGKEALLHDGIEPVKANAGQWNQSQTR